MVAKLNILHVEDSLSDAELILEKLKEAGFDCDVIVVEKKDDFIKKLMKEEFNLIFFDFNMPLFNGFEALKIVQQYSPQTPSICISGTVGEENTAELLRLGATDYVLKSNLKRLVSVVHRALKEKERNAERKQTKESLAASEVSYRRLFESAKDGILILDAETGMIVDVNPFLIELLGFSKEQFIEKEIWELGFFKDILANKDKFIELQLKEYVRYEDLPLETSEGEKIHVEFVSNVYLANNKKIIQCNIRDITERFHAQEEKKKATKEIEMLSRFPMENPNPILRFNNDCILLFANEPAMELVSFCGCKIGQIATSFMYDLIKGVIDKGINQIIEKQLGDKIWLMTFVPLIDDGYVNLYCNDISERKKAEDKNLKLFNAVEKTADIIFITDREGIIEYVNPAFESVTGYSKEEAIDNTPRILNSGQMGLNYFQTVWATILNGEVLHTEMINRRKNGGLFFCEQTITPVKNNEGYVTNFISTGKDITERKQAEESRKLRETHLTAIIENQPGLVWLKDINGRFLTVNGSFALSCGKKTPADLLGLTDVDIWPKELAEKYKADDDEVIKKKTPFHVEEPIFKLNQTTWFETFKMPILNETGQVIGTTGFSREITDRKQAEVDLKESEERYSNIVNSSPNLIIIHVNYIIRYVNNIGEMLLEYPTEEIIGKSILDFVSEESKPIVIDNMQRRTAGEDVPSYEVTVITKSGAEKSVLIQATIIHYQKEKAFLGMITDITKIKEYERDLEVSKNKAEEMNRLKSSFLANMSHELRTPMIGILGFSKLLANSEDADTKETGGLIYNSGKRLMETLNLILDLSRIEAGESKLELSDIDLVEEIAETVNLYQATATEKNLLLSFNNTRYEQLYTRTDKKAIDSILNNLINNAIKYTYKGSIKVTVAKMKRGKEDWALIEVTDTGIGIEEKNIKMIFREFRQVSEGLERSFDGTGLGLTLTKKYIELIGGTIIVKSKINEGSIFTVSFPIVPVFFENDELPADEEIINNVIQKEITHKKNILIVEDDKVTIIFVKRILKDKYNMDTATNAMEAIDYAEKKQYDLILMDINLGRSRNGIYTTKEIRKMTNYKDTPIIAMTAFAMTGDKEDFLAEGCSHYISKPFESEDLIALIEIALEQKKPV